MSDRYPTETLDHEIEDDGTMPANVDQFATAVIGHKIIHAEQTDDIFRVTLDNGTQVELADTDDCCAFTHLNEFLLDPAAVDHIITGVGTTDQYTVWHVYADWGDILRLHLDWSCGNPFYYGYGFDIRVRQRQEHGDG